MSITPAAYASSLPEQAVARYPEADMLVSGEPRQLVHLGYATADKRLRSGIWECAPGAYRIAFGPGKHEFFQMLSGAIRVHDLAGGVTEYVAGSNGVIPPGFEGVFEVTEPSKKHFVISE